MSSLYTDRHLNRDSLVKGHPHTSIIIWEEFLAIRNKHYAWLREFPDKRSNFGLLYECVYEPLRVIQIKVPGTCNLDC